MADQAAPPHAAPAAPPLVGRGRELATLRDALAAALAGRGSLVLIGGEAGIGKTTLAEALCAEATTQGALVLVGPCYDLAETPPYGPWAEALDRWPALAELPPRPALLGVTDAVGVAETQAMRFARLRGALLAAAARRPLVLVLEDLHWADPASLELLRSLARGLADAAILLIGTYRAEDLRRGHPLYALLPALVREAHALRLDLRPLGDDDLRALVRARHALTPWDEARLVAYLGERAGGNPLFAGELLRALAEEGVLRPVPADGAVGGDGAGWALGGLAGVPVPALLRQVIDARVARLGEDAYRLLGLAATIGQEVPLALWRAAGAGDAAALAEGVERALAAGILRESQDGRGVRFAHALIREALYAGVPLPRRERLHGRIGDALLARADPDPDAVAYHLRRAGDPRAAAWLVRAGGRAQRAYAWPAATERFAAALRALEADGAAARERGWLLSCLAGLRRIAEPARSLADARQAARLAEEAGDAALASRVLLLRGELRCAAGDYRGGLHDLASAVATWDALPRGGQARPRVLEQMGLPPFETFFAFGGCVIWLANAGRYAEARTLAERVLAGPPVPAAAVGQHSPGHAPALVGLACAHAGLGRPVEARHALAQARAEYRGVSHYASVIATVVDEIIWVGLPYEADRPTGWQPVITEAEDAQERSGDPALAPLARLARLPILLLEGRWAEAREAALAARASGGQAWRRLLATTVLGQVARARGETDLAWQLVRETLPAGPGAAPEDTLFLEGQALQRLAAALALGAGDLPTAQAWLAAHDRWLAWGEAVRGRADGQVAWAEYHRAAGDPALARKYAEAAVRHAAAPRQPLALLVAHRLLGELATDAGRHADAARHLEAALALAEACAAPYERALTLLALAEARVAGGELAEARLALDEARAICAPLEAAPALARAAALTARLAASPPPARPDPPAYPAGLSAREVEVLRLVAAGLTNPEVAARLFLSPRTVGQHLRAIYAKLDVATRTAAARFAQDHGLL